VPQTDFDAAVEAYRAALDEFLKGDPEPAKAFFSRRDDVTLANPLGPPRRGPAEVDKTITEAAANFRDGSMRIEELSRYSSPDVGYVLQLEHTQARLPGSDDMTPFALRATVIFRREGDTWKVAHRHADPITTARPISSVVQA
jgi:ketosteroid isomerase-like protein